MPGNFTRSTWHLAFSLLRMLKGSFCCTPSWHNRQVGAWGCRVGLWKYFFKSTGDRTHFNTLLLNPFTCDVKRKFAIIVARSEMNSTEFCGLEFLNYIAELYANLMQRIMSLALYIYYKWRFILNMSLSAVQSSVLWTLNLPLFANIPV